MKLREALEGIKARLDDCREAATEADSLGLAAMHSNDPEAEFAFAWIKAAEASAADIYAGFLNEQKIAEVHQQFTRFCEKRRVKLSEDTDDAIC